MQTTLTLLARDGTVFLALRPSLSARQYAALRETVSGAGTAAEMRRLVEAWAGQEGLTVLFDEADAFRPVGPGNG